VNQRLSSLKCKTLSFVGRVTLAKSVLQALPSYVWSFQPIPIISYATYHNLNDTFNKTVASFVDVNGNWQLRDVINCLQAHIIETISTMPTLHPRNGDGALPLFSLASAYNDMIHCDHHIVHVVTRLHPCSVLEAKL